MFAFGARLVLKLKERKIKKRQRRIEKRRRFLERPLKEVSNVGGEEDQLSVCLVVNMDYKSRWYELNPTFDTGSSKSKTRYGPCLLCEVDHESIFGFRCAFLDSKIYVIGGLEYDSALPGDHNIPSSSVHVIHTPSFGKSSSTTNLSVGTGMYGGKSWAITAVLDGKIYAFGSSGADLTGEPWAEVFDPALNRWEGLPDPCQEVINISNVWMGKPVVYEKQKKILVFFNGVCKCYFDISSNLWKYDLTIPRNGQYEYPDGIVIVDDRLYMFCVPKKELYAYDLDRGGQFLIPVHGLQKAVKSMNLSDLRARSTYLFHLGNGKICLVWLVGIFSYDTEDYVDYYRVHCLKFTVKERDGGLHAVVDRCDYYFLKGRLRIFDCFSIKRATLSENRPFGVIVPCSFSGDQQTRLKTRHARRVYVEGFSSAANPQTIETFFNDSLTSSCDSGVVCDVYVDKGKKFAIVEMRSEQAASRALELNGSLFQGAELKIRRPTDYNCKKDSTFEFKDPDPRPHPRSYWQQTGRWLPPLSERGAAPAK